MFKRYKNFDELLKDFPRCRVCGLECSLIEPISYRRGAIECKNHYFVHLEQYKWLGIMYLRARQETMLLDDTIVSRRARIIRKKGKRTIYNEVMVQIVTQGTPLLRNWIYYIDSFEGKRPTRRFPWGKFKKIFSYTDNEIFKEKIKKISRTISLL